MPLAGGVVRKAWRSYTAVVRRGAARSPSLSHAPFQQYSTRVSPRNVLGGGVTVPITITDPA